jgi:uncharacterized repeat protein (TIGR01451 family)
MKGGIRSGNRSIALMVVLCFAAAAFGRADIANAAATSIQFTKVADAASVSAGDRIGYTIAVTPSGRSRTSFIVVDSLPTNPGTSWSINPANPNCAISSGALACSVGQWPSGVTFSVHIVSPTTPSTCGTVVNSANLSAPGVGSSSTPPVPITVKCPTLQVTKSADAASIRPGDRVGYTVVGLNSGGGNAYGFALTDSLPSGLTWSLDPAGSDSSCTITNGSGGTQTLRCARAVLAPTSSISAHVTATTSAANCSGISNSATVSATNATSATVGPVTVAVTCLPDLVVQSIAFTTGSPYTDSPWYYTATIKNQGTGAADLSGVPVQGYFAATAGTWPGDVAACGDTFNNGTILAPGATADILIGCAGHPAPGDNWLAVKVNYEAPPFGIAESDTTNNVNSVPLPVTLSVTKAADNSTVTVGDQVGYTIVGTNNGPVTAYGFTLVDTLPAGLSWSLDTANSDASCVIAANGGTQVLTCAPATVPPGGSVSAHVTATSSSAVCAGLSNSASVSALSASTVATAAVPIDVMCSPDLIVSHISLGPFSPTSFDYIVTVGNQGNGPADLSGVVVQGVFADSATGWPGNAPACGRSFNSGTTLQPGATIDMEIDCGFLPPTYDDYLLVEVDAGNVLAESDETNNIGSLFLGPF